MKRRLREREERLKLLKMKNRERKDEIDNEDMQEEALSGPTFKIATIEIPSMYIN